LPGLLVAFALVVASPAAALQEPQAPEGFVTATGVLERPEITTYQYGEYAVTDEATGTPYALDSESVDLGAYLGEEATVTGTVVPGYEEGAVEGGPALLEVTAIEGAEGDTGGGTGGAPSDDGTATATFRLVVEGEVPEDFSFYVEDSQGTGGVICTTDKDVLSEANYPECRGGGATNEVEFPVGTGQPLDYRILGSRGVELSQRVVSEGSLTPTDDFVVDASYSFEGDPVLGSPTEDQYDPADPDASTPEAPEEPDLNGDGAVDAADERYAARVSTRADRATDGGGEPVLPDTGGNPVPVSALLLAFALLGGGLLLRQAGR
jgi:hypothetical protein